jgi:hypothetical protein
MSDRENITHVYVFGFGQVIAFKVRSWSGSKSIISVDENEFQVRMWSRNPQKELQRGETLLSNEIIYYIDYKGTNYYSRGNPWKTFYGVLNYKREKSDPDLDDIVSIDRMFFGDRVFGISSATPINKAKFEYVMYAVSRDGNLISATSADLPLKYLMEDLKELIYRENSYLKNVNSLDFYKSNRKTDGIASRNMVNMKDIEKLDKYYPDDRFVFAEFPHNEIYVVFDPVDVRNARLPGRKIQPSSGVKSKSNGRKSATPVSRNSPKKSVSKSPDLKEGEWIQDGYVVVKSNLPPYYRAVRRANQDLSREKSVPLKKGEWIQDGYVVVKSNLPPYYKAVRRAPKGY